MHFLARLLQHLFMHTLSYSLQLHNLNSRLFRRHSNNDINYEVPCVKKNQLDAPLILSIFRQPLHISGVSRPIIRRYNRMYTTVGTYYSFSMTVVLVGLEHQLSYTYGCTS
jgi:hypothetical protein